MGDWFMAGGFGMILIVVVGFAALGFAGRAALDPTQRNLRVARSAPGALIALAIATFGLDLWAVHRHAGSDEWPAIAMVGLMEAAQPLTLGGFLAALVALLVFAGESRRPAVA